MDTIIYTIGSTPIAPLADSIPAKIGNVNGIDCWDFSLKPANTKTVSGFANFALAKVVEINTYELIDRGNIDAVRSIFIDNINNPNELILFFDVITTKFIVPANTQAWVPTPIPNPTTIKMQTETDAGLVPFLLINVVMPVSITPMSGGGGSLGGNVNIDAIGGVPVTGDIPVSISAPVEITRQAPTLTDYSILAMAGTSETLVAAGDGENYFIVYNPTGGAAVVVNLAGGDASTAGVVLPPGGQIELPNGVANEITIAGTLGDTVYCYAG